MKRATEQNLKDQFEVSEFMPFSLSFFFLLKMSNITELQRRKTPTPETMLPHFLTHASLLLTVVCGLSFNALYMTITWMPVRRLRGALCAHSYMGLSFYKRNGGRRVSSTRPDKSLLQRPFLPNFIFFFSPSLPFFLLLSIDSESYLSVFSPSYL